MPLCLAQLLLFSFDKKGHDGNRDAKGRQKYRPGHKVAGYIHQNPQQRRTSESSDFSDAEKHPSGR